MPIDLRESHSKTHKKPSNTQEQNKTGGSFDPVQIADPTSPKALREAWNHTYSLNVTSSEATTHALAALLLKAKANPPRLIFVTSGLSSLARVASGYLGGASSSPIPAGWPKPTVPPSFIAYRSSKAALNMQMLEWSRMLAQDGVKVFAVSPGFLATGLGGVGADKLKARGAGDASIGGEFIRDVLQGVRDESSGTVVCAEGVQDW